MILLKLHFAANYSPIINSKFHFTCCIQASFAQEIVRFGKSINYHLFAIPIKLIATSIGFF